MAHPRISLQVQYNFPWPLACLIVVLCAGRRGLINGLLVEVAQIDSFIATLGTGTILYALALWHTGGRQVIGELPPGFVEINGMTILGVPIPAVYVLVLAVALWITTERMPLGRHIYAIGANEKAAALNGIPVRAYVIGVFVASGLIVGFTGCVLASTPESSGERRPRYLLPALVGTFLVSTTIRLVLVIVGTCGAWILAGRHFPPSPPSAPFRRAVVTGSRSIAIALAASPSGAARSLRYVEATFSRLRLRIKKTRRCRSRLLLVIDGGAGRFLRRVRRRRHVRCGRRSSAVLSPVLTMPISRLRGVPRQGHRAGTTWTGPTTSPQAQSMNLSSTLLDHAQRWSAGRGRGGRSSPFIGGIASSTAIGSVQGRLPPQQAIA